MAVINLVAMDIKGLWGIEGLYKNNQAKNLGYEVILIIVLPSFINVL